MKNHYYGTVPALQWVFGRYFYGYHHLWLAAEFHTHRRPNPKSSNPYKIYQDLYEPWVDRDHFDKFITQSRANIRTGVADCEQNGILSSADASAMKRYCDDVDIVFMCPIVVRVDYDVLVTRGRTLHSAGSATTAGSHECLVKDLQEGDYEILFLDFDADGDFHDIVYDAYYNGTQLSKLEVSRRLDGRC